MKLHQSDSAFTLIELLVVISIIAILAALAIPTLGRAIERARASQDGNNMRQIAMGAIGYALERDGDLPGSAEAEDEPSWVQVVDAYISSGTATEESALRNPNIFRSAFDTRPNPISFGINPNVTWLDDPDLSPTNAILIAPNLTESAQVTFRGSVGEANTLAVPPTAIGGTFQRNRQGERGRINAAFADGHVELMRFEVFSDAESNEGQRRWAITD